MAGSFGDVARDSISVSDGGMATNVIGNATDIDSEGAADSGELLGDSGGGEVLVSEEIAC